MTGGLESCLRRVSAPDTPVGPMPHAGASCSGTRSYLIRCPLISHESRRHLGAPGGRARCRRDSVHGHQVPGSLHSWCSPRDSGHRRRDRASARPARRLARVEDAVLSKLEWAKLGGSDRQIGDVATLLRICGEKPGSVAILLMTCAAASHGERGRPVGNAVRARVGQTERRVARAHRGVGECGRLWSRGHRAGSRATRPCSRLPRGVAWPPPWSRRFFVALGVTFGVHFAGEHLNLRVSRLCRRLIILNLRVRWPCGRLILLDPCVRWPCGRLILLDPRVRWPCGRLILLDPRVRWPCGRLILLDPPARWLYRCL
jgi:hypothetical protein